MYPLVYLKISIKREGFVTLVTLIWFLPKMYNGVFFYVRRLCHTGYIDMGFPQNVTLDVFINVILSDKALPYWLY